MRPYPHQPTLQEFFMKKIAFTLLMLFIASSALSANTTLQTHKPGIWSVSATKKQNRWIVIHNLDQAKTTGIYHIEVIGRDIRAPTWQIQHLANHIAITEAALVASVLKPLTKGAVYPESFDSAYRAWQSQNQGQGGVICKQPILECLAK